jgi:hypothetical protein
VASFDPAELELIRLAEEADLRPQVNPRAVVNWPRTPGNGKFERDIILPALLNRFFELSRPIADACREPGPNMRLGDAGRFFYLVEALERVGYDRVPEMLLVFLDEFGQLEQRSYDELYLWSIVELSRRNPEHIDAFWPMAVTLDLRFRSASWQRPAGSSPVDEPYRLIELVMYYYVPYTVRSEPTGEMRPVPFPIPEDLFIERYRERHGEEPEPDQMVLARPVMRRRYPSLLTCLHRVRRKLQADEDALLMDTLRELVRRRPAFGDAHGHLTRK